VRDGLCARPGPFVAIRVQNCQQIGSGVARALRTRCKGEAMGKRDCRPAYIQVRYGRVSERLRTEAESVTINCCRVTPS